MTTQNSRPEEFFPAEYETPRVVTHSGKSLSGKTVDVNACTSSWGGAPDGRSASGSDEGDTVRAY